MVVTLSCRVPTLSETVSVVAFQATVFPDSAVFEFPGSLYDTSPTNQPRFVIFWDTPDLHLGFLAEGIGFFPHEILRYAKAGSRDTTTLTIGGGYRLVAQSVGDGHAMTRETALVEKCSRNSTILILRSSATFNHLVAIHPDSVRMNVTPPTRENSTTRIIGVRYKLGRSR